MIFVCVGSRDYQFDRLLKKLDEIIKDGSLTDSVYAQIGQSSYLPQYYDYERYISIDKFKEYQRDADLIISHGGTGALIGALKLEKQVIAVPRLAKFREHIDNHQLQVVGVLENQGYLRSVIDISDLLVEIQEILDRPILKKYNKTSRVIAIVDDYIKKSEQENR